MKRENSIFCYLLLVMILLSGCGKDQDKPDDVSASGTLSVYVVNYPLKYFAERIGGERVEVHFPAPGSWSVFL